MRGELGARVVPALRERGLRGSFPHFRRVTPTATDLLTFQFDKWGGGFVIELAVGPGGEFVTPWGAVIPAMKLTAVDLPTEARARLQPGPDGSTESWFRYDAGLLRRGSARFERAADAVLQLLPQADAWWRGERPQPNILGF